MKLASFNLFQLPVFKKAWLFSFIISSLLLGGITAPLIMFSLDYGFSYIWVVAIQTVFLGIAYPLCIRFFHTLVGTHFLKGFFDPELVIHQLSLDLLYFNDVASTLSYISSVFVDYLELKHAFSLTLDADSSLYTLRKSDVNYSLGDYPDEHVLVQYFFSNTYPVYFSDLPQDIQLSLDNLFLTDNTLFFPIHSFSKFLGLFILAPHANVPPFSERDMRLLSSIVNQVILVFDRMYYQEKLVKSHKKIDELTKRIRVYEQSKKPFSKLLKKEAPSLPPSGQLAYQVYQKVTGGLEPTHTPTPDYWSGRLSKPILSHYIPDNAMIQKLWDHLIKSGFITVDGALTEAFTVDTSRDAFVLDSFFKPVEELTWLILLEVARKQVVLDCLRTIYNKVPSKKA